MTEDVLDLISPEERRAFLNVKTDEERENFIDEFWLERAPDRRSLRNTFREQHYERIVFANEKYGAPGSRMLGCKTDRGRIYVAFGPPDSTESHQAGETTRTATGENAGTTPYPWELWHYRHIPDVGENVELTFIDVTNSGDYRLVMPLQMRNEPDLVPRDDLSPPRTKIELYMGAMPAPVVRFKDLEAVVTSHLVRQEVPFSYRIEFAKATHATTFATIFVDLEREQPQASKNGAGSRVRFEVFVRVSRLSGWVVDTFESTIPADEECASERSSCRFRMAIPPGTYRLQVVVKDLSDEGIGTLHTTMAVPSYEEIRGSK